MLNGGEYDIGWDYGLHYDVYSQASFTVWGERSF